MFYAKSGILEEIVGEDFHDFFGVFLEPCINYLKKEAKFTIDKVFSITFALKCSSNTTTLSLFSYVPQGNTMLSGTIAENMRNVKEDATDEEKKAAKAAVKESLFTHTVEKCIIIEIHSEIYLVDDFKKIYLKLHC